MSARSEWREGSSSAKEGLKEEDTIRATNEMSTMSFELARHSVDRSMILDRKVIEYKITTVSEPFYKNELVKRMTMEIWYKITNTNPNSIYIPIKVCLEGYNKYELCVYINIVVVLSVLKKDLYLRNQVEKS